jgi:hypothetical protein
MSKRLKGARKQRRLQDRQEAEMTLVSRMLVGKLVKQCVDSGYQPNVGVNSLMTAAGYIVRECFSQGEEAQKILGKHLKAAADEIESRLPESFASAIPEMVN